MRWRMIDSGKMPPQEIMNRDANFLQTLDTHAILHLYDWEGHCLTHGYFTDPAQYLDLSNVQKYQLKMARRPTGGGIIFHLTDLAFSILIPACHHDFSINTLENYAFINRQVIQALKPLLNPSLNQIDLLAKTPVCSTNCLAFCMAQPTQYDIVMNGKKVGGAAQRRTKQGYLHQGSISLAIPPLSLLNEVLKEKSIIEAMHQYTYTLFEELSEANLMMLRQTIRQRLIEVFIN